jgi:hypothetical protein
MTDKLARDLALSALDRVNKTVEGVPRDYVDEHLSRKVDKIESSSANPRLYGVSEAGSQTSYFATQTANAHTIPIRDASGRFQVESGLAPKQAVNKEQLDAAIEATAKLSEPNAFTEQNTFTSEVKFYGTVEHTSNVNITNGFLKILNGNDKDYVTTYNVDNIKVEENGNEYTLAFPTQSGTLALMGDITTKINEKVGFKHSELKNEDVLNNGVIQKEDVWKTGDPDVSLVVQHSDSTNQSGLNISKAFAEMGVHAFAGQSTEAAQIMMTPSSINITSTKSSDTYTTVIITPDGATLNGDQIATEKTVDAKVARIPEGVELSEPESAMQGNLTEEQLGKLQFNKANYILFAGKKYDLRNEREQKDSLSYVYNDYLNNRCVQDVITITVSNRSWVRNSCTLVTNKDYGDGTAGAVSIKKDFSDGLEIATTDGNLSIYGAIDADIAGRNSKRPITATNLNKAVLAALTDARKVEPTEQQKSAFKSAWGIIDAANLLDAEMSDESTNAVQNKVIKAELDNRVKCCTNVQSGQVKVYCATQNNPNDVCLVSSSGTQSSIARYTSTGQLAVGREPSGDMEIANKKFVEGIVPKYGAQLPDPTNGAYKVGCSFLNTTTGGLYVLVTSGSANNRSWQLQTTIEKPKWRNTLPHVNDTQMVDEAKVLFTKVTITTTDSTNFPGMSGKSVTVQGLSLDGFAAGTIVCDETTGDIKYSPCFVGSITSSRASGILIKGSNAVAIVSADNPSVTFTYEYLW